MSCGKSLFKNPEEVQQIANDYFKKFPKMEEAENEQQKAQAKENSSLGLLPTMSGLCLKLGFCDLRQFDEYEKRPRFKAVFKAVRLRLLSYWETALGTGRGTQGVTSWINYVTSGEFLSKTAENQGSRGAVAVVVVGTDGTRQTLQDILTAQQTAQIQALKTINATAEPVTKQGKKQDGRAINNKTKALKRLGNHPDKK